MNPKVIGSYIFKQNQNIERGGVGRCFGRVKVVHPPRMTQVPTLYLNMIHKFQLDYKYDQNPSLNSIHTQKLKLILTKFGLFFNKT